MGCRVQQQRDRKACTLHQGHVHEGEWQKTNRKPAESRPGDPFGLSRRNPGGAAAKLLTRDEAPAHPGER